MLNCCPGTSCLLSSHQTTSTSSFVKVCSFYREHRNRRWTTQKRTCYCILESRVDRNFVKQVSPLDLQTTVLNIKYTFIFGNLEDFWFLHECLSWDFEISHSQVICQLNKYSIYHKLLWNKNLELDIGVVGP